MSSAPDPSPYVFIIATDSYTGNFEREMCAYTTGAVGECGVGGENAQLFRDELMPGADEYDPTLFEVDDHINAHELDEHGCGRPTSIWDEGKGKYNALAIFFNEKPTQEMIDLMKTRSAAFAATYKTYAGAPIKILGYSMIKREVVVTDVAI